MAICGDFPTSDLYVVLPTHEGSFTGTKTRIPSYSKQALSHSGGETGWVSRVGQAMSRGCKVECEVLEEEQFTVHPTTCSSLWLKFPSRVYLALFNPCLERSLTFAPVTWLYPLPALPQCCRRPLPLSQGR